MVFEAGFPVLSLILWLPLLGMGISLLLSCLVALAAGLLIFRELNMVTVGFCAILIGLGVDFAILIFGRYQQARNEGADHAQAVEDAVANLGRAVFFGALTTAVGFLALLLSGSAGFTQLGVMIAIGILVAGLLMTTMFFLFVPRRSSPPRHDWILALVKKYVRRMLRAPALILWIATPLLFLLFAVALAPKTPLIFDASTRSMEPTERIQLQGHPVSSEQFTAAFDQVHQTAEQMIALVKEAMRTHTLLVFLFHGVGGGHRSVATAGPANSTMTKTSAVPVTTARNEFMLTPCSPTHMDAL